MTTATTTTQTIHISHANAQPLIRCTARQDLSEFGIRKGETFNLARSSKNDGTYYIVRFDEWAGCYRCSCPARKPCRHEKAASDHAYARLKAARTLVTIAATVTKNIPLEQRGTLNGSNQGFSLLRRAS